mmetsp:Transcript_30043/g.54571  ORF Transcript_30043/g.54571 Transcript_30043/m.54571 type:complete len:402 (+) Transcript_30043:83-1288(+)
MMGDGAHINKGSGSGDNPTVKEVLTKTIQQAKTGSKQFFGDVKDVACEVFPGMKHCGGAGDLSGSTPAPNEASSYVPQEVVKIAAKEYGGADNEPVVTQRSSIGSSDSGMSLDDSGSSSGGKSSSSGSMESSSFGSGSGQFIWFILLLVCLMGLCGGLFFLAQKKGFFGKKKKKRSVTAKPPVEVTPTPPPANLERTLEEPAGLSVEVVSGEPVYLEKMVVDGGVANPVMLQAAPPIVIDEGPPGYAMGAPGMSSMFAGAAGYMPTPQTEFVQPMQQFNSDVGQLQVPQIFPTAAYAAPATAPTTFAAPVTGVPTTASYQPQPVMAPSTAEQYPTPQGMPSAGFIPAPPFPSAPTTGTPAQSVASLSNPYMNVPTAPNVMPAGVSVQAMPAPPYQFLPAGI